MNNIRIVLVNTSHPGNIGAAARAMKTMGLSSLYLVQPKLFPHADATAMAAGADDILFRAVVVETLEEAIADCELVLATSARSRARPWPMLSPREMGEKIALEKQHNVALVFGRESSGLTNEELQLAHYHVQIPSCEDFSSLNVAQAVQVLCYEVRMACMNKSVNTGENFIYPSIKNLEDFYQHFEKLLIGIEFIDAEKPMHQMQKLRRLFAKARLETSELQLLRGILAELQKSIN
ncbi:MAG: tRNA (cytosine(32)/uridine(32)-2'-O)-methyltransferase TrmJ [Pseudomonadota bacterium]